MCKEKNTSWSRLFGQKSPSNPNEDFRHQHGYLILSVDQLEQFAKFCKDIANCPRGSVQCTLMHDFGFGDCSETIELAQRLEPFTQDPEEVDPR